MGKVIFLFKQSDILPKLPVFQVLVSLQKIYCLLKKNINGKLKEQSLLVQFYPS